MKPFAQYNLFAGILPFSANLANLDRIVSTVVLGIPVLDTTVFRASENLVKRIYKSVILIVF